MHSSSDNAATFLKCCCINFRSAFGFIPFSTERGRNLCRPTCGRNIDAIRFTCIFCIAKGTNGCEYAGCIALKSKVIVAGEICRFEKLYLTLQVFQIALLVQSDLWHVLEKIADLQAAELNRDVLIQSGVVREQVIVSHLNRCNVICNLFLKH